ncbi:hypothetical protein BKA63DRAFT_555785 [Paraphoma chrysanthemicola]|nr:hypothetical protein BKA63DRAFT_555785 [Paraphoma chrysanthemicola]
MRSLASQPNFHPWSRLPNELKLRVLDFRLHLTRPLTEQTHSSHIYRGIRELSLVNKDLRHSALRLYYGNGISLKRHARSRSRVESSSWCFWHPRPAVGQFAHKMQLQLTVDDSFALPTCRDLYLLCDWFLLMRPTTDSVLCDEPCDGCATNKTRSDWQLTLPHLEYLDLQIGVYGLSRHGGIISPARCVTRFEYNEHEKESKLRRR